MKKKSCIAPLFFAFAIFVSISFAEDQNSANKATTSKPCNQCEICPPSNPCDPCNSCSAPAKEECAPCKKCEICPPCEPCKPCCTDIVRIGEPCNCAYNAPARIDPACGWDTWISGSFLYWQAKEKGLELAQLIITHRDDNFLQKQKLVNMKFDYHPAFKLGFGYSFERDDWNIYLEYTRFNAKDSKTINISDDVFVFTDLITLWFSSVDTQTFTNISAKWKLDYNMFDLEISRPYYLGKKIIFKPHYGLRGGWINQKYNLDAIYFDSGIDFLLHARQKENSWLIGPRAGIDSDWLIGCDFRIFANIAGSLFYQKFDTTIKQFAPITPSFSEGTFAQINNKDSFLTPNIEFELGLGYGSYFYHNQWHFDLTIGYDFHYFWNQNQIQGLSESISIPAAFDVGNLILHGLNLTARIDF